MIVIGVDVPQGVCLLDCPGPGARPVFLDACAAEDLPGVLQVRFFEGKDIAAIGIETPTQVFAFGRAREGGMGARIGIEKALLKARDAAGVVRGVASVVLPSVPIYEGQAHEVRKAVIGKVPKKSADAAVKAFVSRVIRLWPTRSNSHVRDAAIVALFAAAKHQARST